MIFRRKISEIQGCKKMSKKIYFGNRTLETELPAFIMGIVNCTPDSFYSASCGSMEQSVERAFKLIEEGAHVLDLGGESTRPGSEYVEAEEEIRRLVPVIKEIRKESNIPISIDTRKYEVMQACLAEGADVLNDVSAIEDDDRLFGLCASSGAGVILMHKRGIPSNMQDRTGYNDVFLEVNQYLKDRASLAVSKGISKEKIILDPGIGFGKDLEANKVLIARCGELGEGEYPVLMALSRKKCIREMTGCTTEDALYGTLTADLISVLNGASMVRVHDVKPCRDTLMVLKSFIETDLINIRG